MANDYTNSFLLEALGLPVIKDLYSLSDKLGLSSKLIYLLSSKSANYYHSFTIRKRNGSEREIFTPSYSLKLVQKWILKEILEKIKVFDTAMAYKRGQGSGIRRNAEFHKYSLYLLELDLKDFFTSIKREKVFFLFKDIGYNILVSNILANLCTVNGYLPQGGVCSPYLSNLTSVKLDRRINGFCNKRDIIYTRYSDDLTLSCDNKNILNKVENVIEDIIKDEGYEINHAKTRFLSPGSHKRVTGITINDNKIKASKELKRKVRAMIHRSIVTMVYSNNNIIRGYVSYINSIEVGYKNNIINYINRLGSKDDLTCSLDIVDAFNNNKIFNEANNMIYNPNNDTEFITDMYYERQEFLRKVEEEVAATISPN